MKIVIIIPTYNEEKSIKKTIIDLENTIAMMHDQKINILIFDSNSKDKTVAVVKKLQTQFDNIFLETEKEKTGLGSAYVKAMTYAMDVLHADVIVEFDADGSHQPQYLIPMMDAIQKGADVALGSRYVAAGKTDVSWPWYRYLISVLGNWTARVILTCRYKDFTSGFRATKSIFLKPILSEGLLSKNYAYKLHLLWALHQCEARIVEIPIVFIDRTEGYSKFPKNNMLESLKVILLLRYQAIKSFISYSL